MIKRTLYCFVFIFILLAQTKGQDINKCWDKMGKNLLQTGAVELSYDVQGELPLPNEPYNEIRGVTAFNASGLLKQDSMFYNGFMFSSRFELDMDKNLLTARNFGQTEPVRLTEAMYLDMLCQMAKYTPVPLLRYFQKNKKLVKRTKEKEFTLYELNLYGIKARLYIGEDDLIGKTSIQRHDDMYGDYWETIYYGEYKVLNNHSIYVAGCAEIKNSYNKNGKITVSPIIKEVKSNPVFMFKEPGYMIVKNKDKEAFITTERLSPNITLFNLEHENQRVVLVEFNDFLVVINAPENSGNGELVLKQIEKAGYNKPIKYFLFTNRYSAAGVRPFVHKGATIVSPMQNFDHFSFVAKNARSIKPDSLYMDPKMLKIEIIGDKKVFTDGFYTFEAYVLGDKSGYTDDYMFFYFPSEKILMEESLINILANESFLKPAIGQKNLYQAIKEQNLKVESIIQLKIRRNLKNVFPFSEFEQSVKD